jgi:outer membrane lipoprotein-sorting protein
MVCILSSLLQINTAMNLKHYLFIISLCVWASCSKGIDEAQKNLQMRLDSVEVANRATIDSLTKLSQDYVSQIEELQNEYDILLDSIFVLKQKGKNGTSKITDDMLPKPKGVPVWDPKKPKER